jgi:hypothetical protein
MLGAAGAADPVHVLLADLDPNLGQIVHLVGARDAHIVRVSQIRPAPAPTSRTVRHPLIRDAYPRHRVAFGGSPTRSLSTARSARISALVSLGIQRPGVALLPTDRRSRISSSNSSGETKNGFS